LKLFQKATAILSILEFKKNTPKNLFGNNKLSFTFTP